MNRREFISTSTAALALSSVELPGQTGPDGVEAAVPARPLKIGFLGGAHSHGPGKVKVLQESPMDWKVIGILDSSEEVRERYAKLGVKSIGEEELLADADVIAVESDVKDHYRHAKHALDAGKHVHLEKPPSMTLEEFQEIVAIAASKKRLVQMGYMWRHNPGLIAALEAAGKGWLGDVYLVRAEINKLQSAADRLTNDFPGGTMFELGCHIIDPVVRLLGRPTKIDTYLKHSGDFPDVIIDNAIAVLDYPRVTAIVGSSILHPTGGSNRHFHIYGSNGTALVKPLDRPVMELELKEDAGPYKKGKSTIEFPPYRRYVGEFAELADAVRSNKALAVTPEMDLLVHEALLRACGAMDEKR
ncbi:MAG: Gfo/Idh/MocA family oxidoreductase [Verrucomicrobiae bacterium]|jgi:predicted dehydrogenase|nr:Gfo/Idh/MocA family oxidoreductase [Verrucomicrobiae bacterium]